MESFKDSCLSVDRKDIVLVKPSKPTPLEILSLSTIDNDPGFELLCQTIYAYRGENDSVLSNEADKKNSVKLRTDQNDPAAVIEEALSKLLVYYYPLAGKLKRESHDGKLQLNCNSYGVPFVVATTDCKLSSLQYLEGINVKTRREFVVDYTENNGDSSGYHPLVLQVTKFSCGGFTIGMGLSHSVCDGFGASQFFRGLAELASGKTEPSVKPVWERHRLLAVKPNLEFPFNMASLATSPYLPATELVNECFNVNFDTITRLRLRLMKESSTEYNNHGKSTNFTTVEVLGAYVWRSRLRALNLNPDGKTVFGLIVGIRPILNPPLPEGYYGNAIAAANVILTGRELEGLPLFKVSQLIKESKILCNNNDYVKNSINNLGQLWEVIYKNIEGGTGAIMMLTDWRQLGLMEEVDFGWGGLVNMITLPWNLFGCSDFCMFMPPCKMDPSMKDGIRVFTCLPTAAIVKFKQEMEALKNGADA